MHALGDQHPPPGRAAGSPMASVVMPTRTSSAWEGPVSKYLAASCTPAMATE
jgi:hypothetical protein